VISVTYAKYMFQIGEHVEQSSFLRKQESSLIMYRLKGGLFPLALETAPAFPAFPPSLVVIPGHLSLPWT
ncbi:MAG: hypothetical protein V3R68_07040, partial [Gammaproteobacteria bacterium]